MKLTTILNVLLNWKCNKKIFHNDFNPISSYRLSSQTSKWAEAKIEVFFHSRRGFSLCFLSCAGVSSSSSKKKMGAVSAEIANVLNRIFLLIDDLFTNSYHRKTASLDYLHTYSFKLYVYTIPLTKGITINQEGKRRDRYHIK